MTLSQGQFDIQVPVDGGTSDSNGIIHTGTTGGAANASGSDHHTIYMVAVPKNQALTMLLGGSIGFAPEAVGATVTNGQIILSSGFGFNGIGVTGGAAGTGGITIGTSGAANFSSDVMGFADGPITVAATSNNINFTGNVTLEDNSVTGVGDIELTADNEHTLSIGGDAFLFWATGSASARITRPISLSLVNSKRLQRTC